VVAFQNLRRLASVFGRMVADNAGNVLPMVALGTIVLAGLVGGGVDMAQAYKAERRLQAACDAGVLAGRRAVVDDGFDAEAVAQANTYFNANFDPDEQRTTNTVFTPTSEDDGDTIEGVASGQIDTIVMRVFGFDTMSLSVTCAASMGIGNSDVMFVLDNTGSMSWDVEGDPADTYEESRMYALEQAMLSFFGTVEAANATGSARVRFGFVPYSSSVNVGQLLVDLDPSYVSDTITIPSRQPVNWSAVMDSWSGDPETSPTTYGDFSRQNPRYTTESACIGARPADETSWSTYDTDTETNAYFDTSMGTEGRKVTATGTQNYQRMRDYECIYREGNSSQRGWYVNSRYIYQDVTSWAYTARDPIVVTTYNATFTEWLYRQVTRSVVDYKAGNAQALTSSVNSPLRARWNTASTWDGCIRERATTPATAFSFVSLEAGITPAEALDLDIDSAPTSDDTTKWKPLWGSATYRRSTSAASLSGQSSSSSGSTYCPFEAKLFQEWEEEDFEQYVEDLTPTGSTYHDIGLIWGARLSSPTGIFADNVNDEPGNGGTVSRHMIFMTDGELAPSLTVNSAWGIEPNDMNITTDGTLATQYSNHQSRYLAICEAIKARGIRLWVIAFGADVDLSDELELRADEPGDTGCSSPDSAFKAENADQLNEYFQEIANQVGELRVIQ